MSSTGVPRSRLHQPGDGPLGKGENVGGKDSHIQGPDDSKDQCDDRSG